MSASVWLVGLGQKFCMAVQPLDSPTIAANR